MAEYGTVRRATSGASTLGNIDAGLRDHMRKVYGLMSVAMLVTFAVAWSVGTSDALFSILRDPITMQPNILGWVVMFAPLGMVFFFGSAVNRLSVSGAQTFFYFFASIMGLSISWIFQAFTGFSVAQVFLVTAIAFASLSLWGYSTKRDISSWGGFLLMGLIGIIVSSLLNLFLQSGALAFAVNVIGILIFSGLTAYDTQTIKNTYIQMVHQGDREYAEKSAILGSLSLYMNFINIFMLLLSLFGERE
jgi:hypothetical protein